MQNTIGNTWRIAAEIHTLDTETDFTYSVNLTFPKPATAYTYSVSNSHGVVFKTASKSDTNQLSFVTSNCFKPRFPYRIFDHPLRIRGLEVLIRMDTTSYSNLLLCFSWETSSTSTLPGDWDPRQKPIDQSIAEYTVCITVVEFRNSKSPLDSCYR